LISVKQFLTPQIVIGRKSDSSLALDDESISPLHALIEKRGEDFFISDLGSETGVSVEGVKVLETQIHSGESINLGPYSVRFYIGVPKPTSQEDFEKQHEKPEKQKGSSVSTTLPPEVLEVEVEDSSKDDIPEDRVPPPLPIADEGIGFDDEETEPTDPGFGDEDLSESTDPEIVTSNTTKKSKSAVRIKRIDEEEQIKKQQAEPLSSGHFAEESSYDSVDEILDPTSRGSVVQVLICWKERVLKTYHFTNSKSVYLSNVEGSDVFVPLVGPDFKHKLLTLSDTCRVHLSPSMSGTLFRNNQQSDVSKLQGDPQVKSSGSSTSIDLEQGQMIQLNLLNDRIVAYVSYVEDTPKAQAAPVLDFTSSEVVGVFMSGASIAILALYMLFYAPANLNDTDKLLEDRLKKAVITFNPPPPITKIEKLPTPPPEIKKPIKTKVTEKKAKPKKVKEQIKAGVKNPSLDKKKPGKPKQAAPSRKKTKSDVGSSRPGGSVNTGKEAANMESKKKDVTKTGLLSVLSGGGKNTVLDKASSGVGQTIGTADSKTGFQGQMSDQAGEGIGTKLQKAGKGGQGSALAGAGDIKTSGRGGGQGGYGVAGLGGKGNSTIVNVDGDAGEFSSSIDKEAIRRLIRRNKNAIAACYERALVQNSSLSGKVILSWNIVEGGKMTSPKVVSSSLGNQEVEKCLIRRLMGLTFPSPGPNEIAEVTSYPFVFESGR
jgi:hypothetical protein